MTFQRILLIFLIWCFNTNIGSSNTGYWQQHVAYTMSIDFDHTRHQFSGKQQLVYTNNSPDTLHEVFYHLYFNAFQPGSAMDVRSRTVADPDERIADRIQKLNENEIGYHRIESLFQDGKALEYEVRGTLLLVKLATAIHPRASTVFDMQFKSQVPLQIRRSGRMNSEGVHYTMTQWYPKMAEYDMDGWHTDPYVAREFHGVFGSFDVSITIDSSYTLAGTGTIQNADEVGHDYGQNKPSSHRLTWHLKADRVHDFAWAADPDYIHTQAQTESGTIIRFFYKNDTSIMENWKNLVPKTVELFNIMDRRFGRYPYPEFSVIQAGDGGMEYPMCTMIVGQGSFNGLVSVTVHEAIHNWYYGVLATNELKYPWMDEGFTTFAQNVVLDSIHHRHASNPHSRSYLSYSRFALEGSEEPLTTHADRYETNADYGVASYSKGCVFLAQLEYIVGEEVFYKAMIRYFNEWQFKHPTPTDFKRVMEKESGIELDWYFEEFIGTTKTIDYSIADVIAMPDATTIVIEKKGLLFMPIEVEVTTKRGVKKYFIPADLMRTDKAPTMGAELEAAWPWVSKFYMLSVKENKNDIKSIRIDPRDRLADVHRDNNVFPPQKSEKNVREKKNK